MGDSSLQGLHREGKCGFETKGMLAWKPFCMAVPKLMCKANQHRIWFALNVDHRLISTELAAHQERLYCV